MNDKIAHAVTALDRVRRRTFAMTQPLGYDDLHRQYTSIMGPLVWDIGHVGNFEEYWLLRELHGRTPYDLALDEVYDPFDNPRPTRGELSILDYEDATRYITEVRQEVLATAGRLEIDQSNPLLADAYVFNMIVQHEAQHQETMLAALDIRADIGPYPLADLGGAGTPSVDDEARILVDGGTYLAGTDDRSAAYDNERPQHPIDVPTFSLDKYPVTARRFEKFVAVGGYRNLDVWDAAGREWLDRVGVEAPQGWYRGADGEWWIRRFGRTVPLHPAEPVQHINLYEALAFARYSGGRLPTEFEWEKAAGWNPATGRLTRYPWGDMFRRGYSTLGSGRLAPMPVGSYPMGASAYGVEQMLGESYEWTTSEFLAYPGYSTFPYPEYSEVFFGPDYNVLRGASFATSSYVARTTFRNWDLPIRRQIFSGLRLAWDASLQEISA